MMHRNKLKVELFTTLGCHLCEDAEHLLKALGAEGFNIEIIAVEIADDPQLMARYGIRIPVVRLMTDQANTTSQVSEELGWPFDLETLRGFLLENSA